MNRKYHKRYELLKDTPIYPAGWPLQWDGTRRKYYFKKVSSRSFDFDDGEPDIYSDYNGQCFTLEQIEAKPEWFKPVGEADDYTPSFPTKGAISEFVDLNFETRLVDDVDVCRSLNDLFRLKSFQDELYDFVKLKYEQLHFKTD